MRPDTVASEPMRINPDVFALLADPEHYRRTEFEAVDYEQKPPEEPAPSTLDRAVDFVVDWRLA